MPKILTGSLPLDALIIAVLSIIAGTIAWTLGFTTGYYENLSLPEALDL
ncbi:MAG: hypothetical protein ACLFTT_07725 [Candidatus Hydrogenedentota bacterium]